MLKLAEIIKEQKSLLENGEVVTVLLNDGVLSICNEIDEISQQMKTVTYIEKVDLQVNCKVKDFISSK